MFGALYNDIIFIPLYNAFIFLVGHLPWNDMGLAIIVFTIIVRLILFPVSRKAIITQVKMREVQPHIEKLKKDYGHDRQLHGQKMMELYKDKGINPLSSIFLLIIQIVVLYLIYPIFTRSGLPVVNHDILYSFVTNPVVNIHFLGLIDITQRSFILALCAGIAQFFQLEFLGRSMKNPVDPSAPQSPQADMTQKMTGQMKYIFPVMIFVIAYFFTPAKLSSILALYWIVTSVFTLVQEIVVRKKISRSAQETIA